MSELSPHVPATTVLEKQRYQEFENFNTIDVLPRTANYQRSDFFEGFDMPDVVGRLHEAFGLPATQRLYLVVFRSQRKEGLTEADIDLLTQQDHKAHTEANARLDEQGNRSLLHYFKGLPDADSYCMSWCIWTSQKTAQIASARETRGTEPQSPEHNTAMRLARQMYQKYGVQTFSLSLGSEGLVVESVKDTWTPQLTATEQPGSLEPPQAIGGRGDVRLKRAIGAVGI